jgi:hypothetical protein
MLSFGRGEAVKCQGCSSVNCACLRDTVLHEHMCDCAKQLRWSMASKRALAPAVWEIEFRPLHQIGVSEVRVRWSWHQRLYTKG